MSNSVEEKWRVERTKAVLSVLDGREGRRRQRLSRDSPHFRFHKRRRATGRHPSRLQIGSTGYNTNTARGGSNFAWCGFVLSRERVSTKWDSKPWGRFHKLGACAFLRFLLFKSKALF